MLEKYRARILLVDDEPSNLDVMSKILNLEAYQAVVANSGALALALLKKQGFDLVITDLRMPGMTGIELLRELRKVHEDLPVIVLTAYGTVDDAVEAMKLGAIDFLSKPVRRENLLRVIQDSLQKTRLKSRIRSDQNLQTSFVGSSVEIQEIRRTIRLLAPTAASVLIEGESGTGKEVVAQGIHRESRRTGSLISVNCGAIPESLLESELFGYERGAFTGANASKRGLFEAADQGTLFLDEIGEMALNLQVKLLRVLQDGVFCRLGSTQSRKADVRIIAATNANLQQKLHDGSFREDLYYRLNVVSLKLPALRARGDDIIALAKLFLEQSCAQYNKGARFFSSEAERCLSAYSWPGNVRELKNVVERTVVLSESMEISAPQLGLGNFLSSSVAPALPAQGASAAGVPIFEFKLGTPLHEIELEIIRRTLEYTGNDKAETARLLGINQRTVYRKLQEMEEKL